MTTRPGEIDITTGWRLAADPEDRGVGERWFARASERGVEGDAGRAWQHVLGHDYHGVAWYTKRVDVPDGWSRPGSRVWLCVEAAATDCRAWVNASEVGRHVGDYAPFQFDATEAIRGRSADVAIRVDEIRGAVPPVIGRDPWIGHVTKGFHDVLSLQHGGMWQRVRLRCTGPATFRPDPIVVIPDLARSVLRVLVTFEPLAGAAELHVGAASDHGALHAEATAPLRPGQEEAELALPLGGLARWSPDAPALHSLTATLRVDGAISDRANARFGIRSVTTGGAGNRQILINGAPTLIRGVLHWGHEPRHIAPAPTPEEVRRQFAGLRAMGINCVCCCMVYMPRHFYEIADETGMLVWQEHPVWKSDMADEHVGEYQRLFRSYFQRDAQHPSVVILSAACEHERFHPGLAAWWMRRARERLPQTILQINTGFIDWPRSELADVWDEHVYENTGRWHCYLDDLDSRLSELEPRPFIMGETIIGTGWPDTGALASASGWHRPRCLDGCREIETRIERRWGRGTLERFRRQAHEFNLLIRHAQAEALRARSFAAGWVMNHIRDVPVCQCGFMDDLDRWRFTPDETRPFLADAAGLLRTPDDLRAFEAGTTIDLRVGVSNYSADATDGLRVRWHDEPETRLDLRCPPGAVRFAPWRVRLPECERPARVQFRAGTPRGDWTAWSLWALPRASRAPGGAYVAHSDHDSRPVTSDEPHRPRNPAVPDARSPRMELPFEERAYSSGWGMNVRSWSPAPREPARLLPECPAVGRSAPTPADARIIVTNDLDERARRCLSAGGSVVLVATAHTEPLAARTVMLWAQAPLILESEHGPIRRGESAMFLELLHHDLTRRYHRAIPTHKLGIHDDVEPFIRLILTHDRTQPEIFDALFAARIGSGRLVVSSLDHATPAGRFLLDRLLTFALADDAWAAVPRATI